MIKFNRTTKKLFWITSAILLVFVVVFFSIQKKIKLLDQGRVALVDTVGNNYIFRGNAPFVIKDGKEIFAQEELTSYFNNILSKQGHDSLQDYYLIDVNLLDLDQYYTIKKEQKFFKQHPEYGEMIYISTLSPSLLIEYLPINFVTSPITKNYNLWITKTLNEIHDLALRQTNKPVVIYIHCGAGRDRTGLMVAGYRMLFSELSLSEVKSQNVEEVGRSSRDSYDRAMHSYCLYTKKLRGKADDYCL